MDQQRSRGTYMLMATLGHSQYMKSGVHKAKATEDNSL